MKYISTRGNHEREYKSWEAILKGMVPNGGLFIPNKFPKLSLEDIEKLKELSYKELAIKILELYLDDFSKNEIVQCVERAYDEKNFSDIRCAPVDKLDNNLYTLDLWHGPTAAFKDMALQLMPKLFEISRKKGNLNKKSLVLVATSGDTGKAALEGFKGIDGVDVAVLYPKSGVSLVQELQMVTTEGSNNHVFGVLGNFDDCQNTVKEIFADKEFRDSLEGIELSSANSINFGRLLPQIVYYFKGYLELLTMNEIYLGEEIDFSVPTGNFGNILAGYYAKKMGLPIGRLICASNKNNVLADFFSSGVYDRRREFHRTMSPSMDILISSNLERYLYHTLDDGPKINKFMDDLKEKGFFELSLEDRRKVSKDIREGYCSEEECLRTMRTVYLKYNKLIDPHTAVALRVGMDNQGDRKLVALSTASIYKFPESVLHSLDMDGFHEFKAIERLNSYDSRNKIHRAVDGLKNKKVLHEIVLKKEEIKEVLLKL